MPRKKDPALMERYRAACKELYEDDELVEYCAKKVGEVVELPNGLMVEIDKEHIRTQFCFGYSDIGQGPTYEEAWKNMRDADTNEAYFLRKNMEAFDRVLEGLYRHGHDYMVVLTGNTKHLRGLHLKRATEVLEAVGGCAFLPALKGQELEFRGTKGYVCTDEDVALLRDGYERAAKAHLSKCRAYLKRYGLSKLSTRMYWIDE